MNINNVLVGSIIHGTLRPQDLAAAFLELADHLDIEVFQAVRTDVERIAANPEQNPGDAEALIVLGDIIDNALPLYLYLGTAEGDGSDWGVWYMPWCDEELGAALLAADRAAVGDNRDEEVRALREALTLTVDALRQVLDH